MIKGKRVKVPQWIHAQLCVVRVEVDAVIPDEDPSEPCFEPAAVKWMDELQRLADAGQIDELAKIGEVFVRRSA
jgi:hypothetical protein